MAFYRELEVVVTRCFSEWSSQDDKLKDLHVCRKTVKLKHSKEVIRELRGLGMPGSTLGSLYGMMKDDYETGYATFSEMRFLCWYWGNGDKIIFPLNSKNMLYIGNDSIDWCRYWPFFHRISDHRFICRLGEHEIEPGSKKNAPMLGIGGQSHYGHFVANRVGALYQSALTAPYLSTLENLLVPEDYIELHEQILTTLLDGKKIFHRIPKINGIHTFTDVVIPSIDEHSHAITGLKGEIECRHSNRMIKPGKRCYITRATGVDNDRISNYQDFCGYLEEQGFLIINPVDKSFAERLDMIGDCGFILTDPGSCALNGILFGNKKAKLKCMIPKSVIASTDPIIINQLCLGFEQGVQGQWLPVNSSSYSEINPWYDVLEPPGKDYITQEIG